jgi:hypothetical protein
LQKKASSVFTAVFFQLKIDPEHKRLFPLIFLKSLTGKKKPCYSPRPILGVFPVLSRMMLVVLFSKGYFDGAEIDT